MNKLTPEHLIIFNQKIVGENSSDVLRIQYDMLVEITEIPYKKNEELFYVYKSSVEKAAKLGNLIATRKPFLKANQETAILTILTLLDINGCKVINYVQDLDDLRSCLEESNEENICLWIRKHLKEELYPN